MVKKEETICDMCKERVSTLKCDFCKCDLCNSCNCILNNKLTTKVLPSSPIKRSLWNNTQIGITSSGSLSSGIVPPSYAGTYSEINPKVLFNFNICKKCLLNFNELPVEINSNNQLKKEICEYVQNLMTLKELKEEEVGK